MGVGQGRLRGDPQVAGGVVRVGAGNLFVGSFLQSSLLQSVSVHEGLVGRVGCEVDMGTHTPLQG